MGQPNRQSKERFVWGYVLRITRGSFVRRLGRRPGGLSKALSSLSSCSQPPSISPPTKRLAGSAKRTELESQYPRRKLTCRLVEPRDTRRAAGAPNCQQHHALREESSRGCAKRWWPHQTKECGCFGRCQLARVFGLPGAVAESISVAVLRAQLPGDASNNPSQWSEGSIRGASGFS